MIINFALQNLLKTKQEKTADQPFYYLNQDIKIGNGSVEESLEKIHLLMSPFMENKPRSTKQEVKKEKYFCFTIFKSKLCLIWRTDRKSSTPSKARRPRLVSNDKTFLCSGNSMPKHLWSYQYLPYNCHICSRKTCSLISGLHWSASNKDHSYMWDIHSFGANPRKDDRPIIACICMFIFQEDLSGSWALRLKKIVIACK